MMFLGNSGSPPPTKYVPVIGIEDDRTLSELLRREMSCTDAGHLRAVLRDLILSHKAANERIRELDANLKTLSGSSPKATGRL
jgi:transposase